MVLIIWPGGIKLAPMPFPTFNGVHDFKESMPAIYTRYYGIMGVPPDTIDPNEQYPAVLRQDAYLEQLMNTAFGDRIDMRSGYYSPIPGYTLRMDDAAEQMANEGFTKMLLARETTDHNRYANEFMTGNYIKERLCEIGKLNSIDIKQTRQVGRTPEFNTMNVRNIKPFIEAYPEGSTIGIIYTTRGLPWRKDETPKENRLLPLILGLKKFTMRMPISIISLLRMSCKQHLAAGIIWYSPRAALQAI